VHHFGLELLQACKNYGKLLQRRRQAVTDSNDFPDLAWADILALMHTFIERRLQAIADPSKADLRFLGEKDPEHAMHLPTLHQLFPEGRVIHIVRDGRGVLLSAWHHNHRSGDDEARRLDLDALLDLTAKEWADRVIRARLTGQAWGDRYFEVRYEDLVADPHRWFGRTLTFLGADASPEVVAACVEAASFERLSQGRRAGDEDAASFFRKGVPDEWRTGLTASQIERFKRLSGTALPSFGYFSCRPAIRWRIVATQASADSRSLRRWISGCSGNSYTLSMPVKLGRSPRRALAYSPLGSRASPTSRGASTNTARNSPSGNSSLAMRRSARKGEMKETRTMRPA
jgi:hypothetical protein